MNQFRGDSAFSTWLTRLVLNECLARLRRDARRQNVVPLVTATPATEAELDNVAARDADLPESVLNRMQVRELLERKLDDLPDSYRAVFVLRSVEDLTIEEVARILDLSEATVRVRHFRARATPARAAGSGHRPGHERAVRVPGRPLRQNRRRGFGAAGQPVRERVSDFTL